MCVQMDDFVVCRIRLLEVNCNIVNITIGLAGDEDLRFISNYEWHEWCQQKSLSEREWEKEQCLTTDGVHE